MLWNLIFCRWNNRIKQWSLFTNREVKNSCNLFGACVFCQVLFFRHLLLTKRSWAASQQPATYPWAQCCKTFMLYSSHFCWNRTCNLKVKTKEDASLKVRNYHPGNSIGIPTILLVNWTLLVLGAWSWWKLTSQRLGVCPWKQAETTPKEINHLPSVDSYGRTCFLVSGRAFGLFLVFLEVYISPLMEALSSVRVLLMWGLFHSQKNGQTSWLAIFINHRWKNFIL